MSGTGRVFAVVPAAGMSRRMGQPKLLMDLAGTPVIRRLLNALDIPAISDRVVVLRADDERLGAAVASAGATVVQPDTAPADMKASVICAVEYVERVHRPTADDAWMLVPADHPMLERSVVNTIVDAWSASRAEVLLPVYAGQTGHPIICQWSVTAQLSSIPADRGLNWLINGRRLKLQHLAVEAPAILQDLDTPEDYRRLRPNGLPPEQTGRGAG